MKNFESLNNEVVECIQSNEIGIIPTDTIYGVVASALSPRIVEKVYTVKERDRKKPMIVLVGAERDITDYFSIDYPKKLDKVWPAKLSVILPCKKFPHIHRGNKTIAFRVPDKKDLRELLIKTGPIVAPSANPQGREPANNIRQAKKYFGEEVDFYVDQGTKKSKPSTLVNYNKGEFEILREGAVSERIFQ
ncbi:MAG: L-threonylcarbamoyladenylate synthase [Patescibacteria group bacterium]